MCISSILIIDRKKCPETQRNVRKIGTWSGLYDTCRFVWIEKSINCGFHVDAENHNVIYLSELGCYLDHCFSSPPIACENIRFSSLFAAGDVSRKSPQRRRARRNGCFRRLIERGLNLLQYRYSNIFSNEKKVQ